MLMIMTMVMLIIMKIRKCMTRMNIQSLTREEKIERGRNTKCILCDMVSCGHITIKRKKHIHTHSTICAKEPHGTSVSFGSGWKAIIYRSHTNTFFSSSVFIQHHPILPLRRLHHFCYYMILLVLLVYAAPEGVVLRQDSSFR